MLDVIVFILVLSSLVSIHELGHFFAALWAKVKVEEFGIGFPPKVKTMFHYKGVPFNLNSIPFGGYVKMLGETEDEEDTAKEIKLKPGEGPLYEKSFIQKMVVILAGVTANIVFAVFAFIIVFSVLGIPEYIDQARIGYITPNSPAAMAGVPTDVDVIAVRLGEQNWPVNSNQDLIDVVYEHLGQELVLVTSGQCDQYTCQEIAQEFNLTPRLKENIPAGEGALGIEFTNQVFVKYPWYKQLYKSIFYGFMQAAYMGYQILIAVVGLFRKLILIQGLPSELSGPVGIAHQATEMGLVSQGFLYNIQFAGMLSINLAIMNLLPIPVLDGGRALFIILEKLISKKLVRKIEGYANTAGVVFVIGLGIIITIKDIWQIIF